MRSPRVQPSILMTRLQPLHDKRYGRSSLSTRFDVLHFGHEIEGHCRGGAAAFGLAMAVIHQTTAIAPTDEPMNRGGKPNRNTRATTGNRASSTNKYVRRRCRDRRNPMTKAAKQPKRERRANGSGGRRPRERWLTLEQRRKPDQRRTTERWPTYPRRRPRMKKMHLFQKRSMPRSHSTAALSRRGLLCKGCRARRIRTTMAASFAWDFNASAVVLKPCALAPRRSLRCVLKICAGCCSHMVDELSVTTWPTKTTVTESLFFSGLIARERAVGVQTSAQSGRRLSSVSLPVGSHHTSRSVSQLILCVAST